MFCTTYRTHVKIFNVLLVYNFKITLKLKRKLKGREAKHLYLYINCRNPRYSGAVNMNWPSLENVCLKFY